LRSLDRVLLVCNPTAGARHRVTELEDLRHRLETRGLVVEFVTDLEQLTSLSAALQHAGRLRAVIACGGDGTVAEVVNRVGDQVPVTVYPMGTANLLAGYLGIPRDAAAMTRLVADEGLLTRLDAGRANGRIFLLMVGCGFDADVVRRLHTRRRGGHITYFTWAQPILQAMRSYTYPVLRITCTPSENAEPTSQRAYWAFAVNLPVYAAGLTVAPEARADDGLLEVCTFHGGSLWHGIKYVGHVLFRRHKRLTDYHCETATRVRIEADEPVPYQLDGDPGGMLPLDIEMLPGRVTLLAPPAAIRRHQLATFTVETQGVPPQ
jgi:diacylglycerol kinase family enzyme